MEIVKTNKVAICCVAKLENDYIKNFVDFYINIGIDHIFIYDQNQSDEEDFNDVIGDYINNDIVTIIPWQDHVVKQAVLDAYTDCVNNQKDNFDFICFFDPDEFIWLNEKYHNNIKEYLYQDCFKIANVICLNWVTYDDNGLIYKDNRPVQERFTKPVEPIKYFHENYHIKTIINTSIKNDFDFIFKSPHCPVINNKNKVNLLTYFNSDGEELDYINIQIRYVYTDNAYLRHYRCKTIQEYCENKIPKLIKYGYVNVDFDDNFFFELNEWTKEKQDIYNNYIKNNNPYWIDDSKNEYDENFNTQYTILSCAFGNKDELCLNDICIKDKNVKYILITDIDDLQDEGIINWEIHNVSEYEFLNNLDIMSKVKFVKIHPFLFTNDKYCIYIDISCRIKKSINRLMYNFINSNKSIGLMFHPDRTDILQEINAWIRRTQNSSFFKIFDIYEKNEIQSYILFFCSLIIYKNTNKTLNITSNWYSTLWQIGENNCIFRSDQLVLPLVIELLYKQNLLNYNDIFYIAPQLVNSYYIQRFCITYRRDSNNKIIDITKTIEKPNVTKRTLTKYNNNVIKCYTIDRKNYNK